jgi:peptidoglycan-associated lipoprotein
MMSNTTKTYSKLLGQLLAIAAVSAMLVACKSTPMKPAAVEDKSPTSSSAPAANTGADTGGIKEVSVDSNENSGNNPLKDPNNILSKRNIFFDFDSDNIRAEFRPIIEAHAKYLSSHADAKVMLQGNTDARGTREYNLALGQRRSVAVKKALNLLGVQDSQIETVSYGEEKASQTCASEDCYKNDRRAEVVYAGE